MAGLTPPRARDMRDRVTFQRRQAVSDGYGGSAGIWQTLILTRNVSLAPMKPYRKDADQVLAARLQAISLYEMWVRSDSLTRTVTADDRVVDARDASRIFKIRFIEDMERRGVWLFFQLERGAAEG